MILFEFNLKQAGMVLESVSYLLTSTAIYLKIKFLVLLFRLRVDVEPSFVFLFHVLLVTLTPMMAAGGSSAILSFDCLVISLAAKLLHLVGSVFCSILGPASSLEVFGD